MKRLIIPVADDLFQRASQKQPLQTLCNVHFDEPKPWLAWP
jgi:hypothetical protein